MSLVLKHSLLRMLKCALILSLLAGLIPACAEAFTVDVTTAKSNETSSDNVLGGVATRITWEGVVDEGEAIRSLTVQLPQGSFFTDDTTVTLTVMDGTTRLARDEEPVIDRDALTVHVDFVEPVTEGLRIRILMYKTALPEDVESVTLSAYVTTENGEYKEATLDESGNVYITLSNPTWAERLSNWLGEREWVQKWNSVLALKTFLNPLIAVNALPTVLMGWMISLGLVLIGFPLAIPLGLCAAFMRMSKWAPIRFVASAYTGIIRGTPLFLQIYLAFFGLPMLGISTNQIVLAICVLAFNSGAYLCEIFRAGIQSVHKGQFEAARSLGMNSRQTMFYVIIPQTIKRVMPTMTSEFILLYKDTSLLAAVGVMELMLYARSVVSTTGNMTPYVVAAVFYLIVTLPLIKLVGTFEKRLAGNDGSIQEVTSKKKRRLTKKVG